MAVLAKTLPRRTKLQAAANLQLKTSHPCAARGVSASVPERIRYRHAGFALYTSANIRRRAQRATGEGHTSIAATRLMEAQARDYPDRSQNESVTVSGETLSLRTFRAPRSQNESVTVLHRLWVGGEKKRCAGLLSARIWGLEPKWCNGETSRFAGFQNVSNQF